MAGPQMKKICGVLLPYDAGSDIGLQVTHWELVYNYEHGTFEEAVTGALIALRERLRVDERATLLNMSCGKGMEILMAEEHRDLLARFGLEPVPNAESSDEFVRDWDESIPDEV